MPISSPVSIKINKLPTNEMPLLSVSPSGQSTPPILPQTSPAKKRPWLIYCFIALVLVESLAIIYLRITEKTPPFYDILPDNPAAITYINKTPLKEIILVLNQKGYSWPPFDLSKEAILGLADKNNLQISRLTDLLEEKMAFILLAKPTSSPYWMIISTQAVNSTDLNATIDQVKNELKQNLNILDTPYRQVKIIEIKSLKNEIGIVYLAMAKNYVLLSNSQDDIKQTIDKILK